MVCVFQVSPSSRRWDSSVTPWNGANNGSGFGLGMNSVELPEVEIDPHDFSKCLSPYEAVKKVEGTGPSATRLRAA
eukprot:2881615-Rhodomonas_salina.2